MAQRDLHFTEDEIAFKCNLAMVWEETVGHTWSEGDSSYGEQSLYQHMKRRLAGDGLSAYSQQRATQHLGQRAQALLIRLALILQWWS